MCCGSGEREGEGEGEGEGRAGRNLTWAYVIAE